MHARRAGKSDTSMADAALSVETLETTVRIATLPFSALPACLHGLLQLVFFHEDEPDFQTISIAQGKSVTLVATAQKLEKLKAATESLNVDDTDWAVVRVGVGSEGQNQEMVGLVERLTEPLASAGIPVLYQSTYSTEYVLIPRSQLDEALECLAALDASERAPDEPTDAAAELASRHHYPLTVLSESHMRVLRLDKRHRQRHTGALVKLLFMPPEAVGGGGGGGGDGGAPSQASICSLTETADEISLFAGAEWATEYSLEEPEGFQHDRQDWVAIRVGDAETSTPLSETGVVATQAKVLAGANLSILYHSTFECDFTLVQREQVDTACEAFELGGFTVIHQGEPEEQGEDEAGSGGAAQAQMNGQ